ncbi:hypothetical protein GQ53DRAFT_881822 [Thozetella sp. PMI_491]|nr:hypothetical protein GQ53DRAFT_881822 [Thozetella sp. PMI_491]
MSSGPGSHPSVSTLKWDPDVDLHLQNPDTGFRTCVGSASSKGRRCQKRVASASEGRAALLILAQKDPATAANSNSLDKAADSTLCHLHKSQVPEIVARWRQHLQDLAAVDKSQSESNIRAEYEEMTDDQLLKRLFILYDVLNSRPTIQRHRRNEETWYSEKQAETEPDSEKDQKKKQSRSPPCPTKSGDWEDATQTSITAFYENISLLDPSPSSDEMYRLLSVEKKRWQPDEIELRFGPAILQGKRRAKFAKLTMIGQIVEDMWKEAKQETRRV